MQKMKLVAVESINQIKDLSILAKNVWEEHYIPFLGKEQVNYMISKFQSSDAILSQIENDNYEYFFITLNDETAGYIGIKKEENKIFLSKLYIEKSFRKKGLSHFVIDCLINIMSNETIDEIYLTVNKNNVNSIKAYKKLGFSISDKACSDIGNGFVMDDYIMRKKI